MHVVAIEVNGFKNADAAGNLNGMIAVLTDRTRICVSLTVPAILCKTNPNYLVKEALRQIRRMPELRNGGELTFAPEILGLPLAA